jgi:hypothetical protein
MKHGLFANGLRRALIEFYAEREADVVAAGGNPRDQRQLLLPVQRQLLLPVSQAA